MKTRILISCLFTLLSAPASLCLAQATVVTDPDLNALLTTQHTDVMTQFQQLNTTANNLSDLLRRIGDPSKVAAPDSSVIAQDISNSAAAGPLTNQQLAAQTAAITGQEVFSETVDGAYTAVGSTYTLKDGTQASRDPTLYKNEAVLLNSIKEYYRVRDAENAIQEQLKTALLDTQALLDSAPDDATVQKLHTQITLINGQLADSRDKITAASNDVAIREKEIINQNRVQAKADTEGAISATALNNIKALFSPANVQSAVDLSNGQGLHWGPSTPPPASPAP